MNEKVDNACIPKKRLFQTIRSALVFDKIPGKLQKKKWEGDGYHCLSYS